MLKSEFIEKTEYPSVRVAGKKKKFGCYHRSYFPNVKEFGRTFWVVIADINILEEHEEGNPKKVAERCIEYLNQPIGKRKAKLPYGELEIYDAIFMEKDEKSFLRTHIITKQKKNKNFWGAGISVASVRRRRKK